MGSNLLGNEGAAQSWAVQLQLAVHLNESVGHRRCLRFCLAHVSPHEALHRVEGAQRVHHRLALCSLPHESFAILGEGHDAGR
mmetsp:Transcript_16780/g.36832  ORF Transcript_16780/g.36832 Transcript_16780/m.36832 type:complete len:83 (+) Transcript_16780:1690-1938(+)